MEYALEAEALSKSQRLDHETLEGILQAESLKELSLPGLPKLFQDEPGMSGFLPFEFLRHIQADGGLEKLGLLVCQQTPVAAAARVRGALRNT